MQSLRGVTLHDADLVSLLRDHFVLSWRNIEKETHVGLSHGYRCDQTAVGTTNGAGGRNLQIVVLAPDRTVLHVLPGFWHPVDLAAELQFARALHRLFLDEDKSSAEKLALFAAMHRAQVKRLSPDTIARSDWQDFDRSEELNRSGNEPRDTIARDETGQPRVDAQKRPLLVPLCNLVHERMAARPFRRLENFDMEHFVDYGRAFYDNNAGLDQGRSFPKAEIANRKREEQKAKEERERAKALAKAAKASTSSASNASTAWSAKPRPTGG